MIIVLIFIICEAFRVTINIILIMIVIVITIKLEINITIASQSLQHHASTSQNIKYDQVEQGLHRMNVEPSLPDHQ